MLSSASTYSSVTVFDIEGKPAYIVELTAPALSLLLLCSAVPFPTIACAEALGNPQSFVNCRSLLVTLLRTVARRLIYFEGVVFASSGSILGEVTCEKTAERIYCLDTGLMAPVSVIE